jgi:hypothetical protein
MTQPRALDIERIGDGPLTRLTGEELAQVERSLKAVLGLPQGMPTAPVAIPPEIG